MKQELSKKKKSFSTKRGKFDAERLTRYHVINFDGICVADGSENGIQKRKKIELTIEFVHLFYILYC